VQKEHVANVSIPALLAFGCRQRLSGPVLRPPPELIDDVVAEVYFFPLPTHSLLNYSCCHESETTDYSLIVAASKLAR
jgi:hypothetical protein